MYKKTDETYMLKMKNSREFYSNVSKKFGTMPFTLRMMENETKAKMGVVECVTHRLVEPFQVLYEKDSKSIYPESRYLVSLQVMINLALDLSRSPVLGLLVHEAPVIVTLIFFLQVLRSFFHY